MRTHRGVIRAVLLAVILAAALFGCGKMQSEKTAAEETASAGEVLPNDGTSVSGDGADEQKQEPVVSERDDFYEAVNGELLAQWEIEPDESVTNRFTRLAKENTELITGIIKRTVENNTAEKGSDEGNIRALYLTGMDQDARNAAGYGRILTAFFEEVDAAKTPTDLMKCCLEFDRNYGFYSFGGISFDADPSDSNKKIPVWIPADMGLSREVWFSKDPSNQNRTAYFTEYLKQLCMAGGYSEEEAENAAEQTVGIMKQMAEESLSLEDSMDPEKTYNFYTPKELEELSSGAVSAEMLKKIFELEPDETLVVIDVKLTKALGSIMTEEHLPALKEYVKLCAIRDNTLYIDMDSYEAAMDYQLKAMGLEENMPFEEQIAETVQSVLGFQCGRLYCRQYFSEETISEVGEIVKLVTEVFGKRISELDWMSEETKAEAEKKLKAMTVRIGHPDNWPQDRYELILSAPEEGGIYVDNILTVAKVSTEYNFETRNDPVDKTLWPDTPQTVNAYYMPQDNSINLPAGILMPPFYDPEASEEENLGSIGMVIAHEITHAFDTSGSQFDENGNLRDWWTPEDKTRFQSLAEEVAAYYDAMEIDGKKVNGSQTVTENIADLGAVACITQIAKEEGYDLKRVYEAYANLWACKCREEYLADQIATDVHAPEKIRVNATLSAQQDFRDLYGITKGDGMYQEMMPKIW